VLELANPEVGAASVEGDDMLETSNGTRAMTTSKGKRKRDGATAALDSLVESSASMAAAAATHTRCAEMVSLSTTLKSHRECHAALSLINAVQKQLEDVVLQRLPTSIPDKHDAPGGSSEEASIEDVKSRGEGPNLASSVASMLGLRVFHCMCRLCIEQSEGYLSYGTRV